jgi:hypothetical protein
MKRTSVFSGIFLGTRADSFAVRFAAGVVTVLVAVVVSAVGLAAFGATAGLGQAAAPGVTAPNTTQSNSAQPNSAHSYSTISTVSHGAAPTSTASNTAAPNAVAPSSLYSVQGTVASAQGAPVSYASVTQLGGLLTQLETTSKAAQGDLTNLRIERWKTDAGTKKQALGNVDSILRNLQNALPGIVEKLRAAPEDVPATFNLYRNLDALYDVLGGVVEETGAFGSKDDFQALANDLKSFEGTRKGLAERLENLATAKESEIVRLRSDLKTAQAAIPVAPPKKTVVDDNEPAKKPPVKKKPAAKPAAPGASTTKPATGSTTAKPAAGQTQAPATPQTPAPKPQ